MVFHSCSNGRDSLFIRGLSLRILLNEAARVDLGILLELTNVIISKMLAGPVGKGHETQVIRKTVEGRKIRFFYIRGEKTEYR